MFSYHCIMYRIIQVHDVNINMPITQESSYHSYAQRECPSKIIHQEKALWYLHFNFNVDVYEI